MCNAGLTLTKLKAFLAEESSHAKSWLRCLARPDGTAAYRAAHAAGDIPEPHLLLLKVLGADSCTVEVT